MRSEFCDGLTRRDLLQVGVLGMTGLSLSGYLRSLNAAERPATAKSCLFINLAGGPSHFETLDVKPEGPVDTRGEFQPIDSAIPGVPVSEYLPRLAAKLDQFALIRGISHTAGAHPQGQAYISTGNRPVASLVHPAYGSVVSRELSSPEDLPAYVAVPNTEWSAGYLGDAYAPLTTGGIPQPGKPFQVRGVSLADGMSLEKVNRRDKLLQRLDQRFRKIDTNSQLLEALDHFGKQAHRMITSARAQSAFDVSRESKPVQEAFGTDDFNQSLLLSQRLIQFGVRFVTVTYQGWDTHLDNFKGHRRLIPPLDSGVTAVVQTLQDKGLLESTLVVVMGEFGRTPKINVNAGRDHYPRVNWCLMCGGGIQPGLIGGTDKGGTAADDATEIHPEDLAASIYHALGIDPRHEYHTPTGRPVMIVPEGKVMQPLFGGA